MSQRPWPGPWVRSCPVEFFTQPLVELAVLRLEVGGESLLHVGRHLVVVLAL
jgi:hypothetical protein